jgi:hypothetical protein
MQTVILPAYGNFYTRDRNSLVPKVPPAGIIKGIL